MKNMNRLIALGALIVSVSMVACKVEPLPVVTRKGFIVFEGHADSSKVTPLPTSSAATGRFTGVYDASANILNYKVSWYNLQSLASAARLQFPSGFGSTSFSTRDAWSGGSATRRPETDSVYSAIEGTTGLSASQLQELRDGKWYFIVQSNAFPNGEIRGQINYLREFQ